MFVGLENVEIPEFNECEGEGISSVGSLRCGAGPAGGLSNTWHANRCWNDWFMHCYGGRCLSDRFGTEVLCKNRIELCTQHDIGCELCSSFGGIDTDLVAMVASRVVGSKRCKVAAAESR